MVAVALIPGSIKPVLVAMMNLAKTLSIEGGKDAFSQARTFNGSFDQSLGKGKFLLMLTTDTPTAMRAMYTALLRFKPWLFWQPDICHSTSLSLKEMCQIPVIYAFM